jgi:hypothetical protein
MAKSQIDVALKNAAIQDIILNKSLFNAIYGKMKPRAAQFLNEF